MKATHKRGDTFDYSDQLVMTVDGVTVTDFTGMTGASQLRTAAGALVATLEFTWLDAAQGFFRVRNIGPTGAWPVTVLMHDVQLTTASGDVISTDSEPIQIVAEVTHG